MLPHFVQHTCGAVDRYQSGEVSKVRLQVRARRHYPRGIEIE